MARTAAVGARAALIAAIPTLYALRSLQLWHVFVLALLAGALSPATTAGVRAFVPHLVDDAALDRANALTATSLQFSYLGGPVAVAGASWAPYTPMETTLLQRLVPAEIRGQVFGARHSLVVAAAPLGAAFGGLLLQYLSAPAVIAISGLACVLAGLGGLVSPALRQLRRESP
jgi:hypothetical protein